MQTRMLASTGWGGAVLGLLALTGCGGSTSAGQPQGTAVSESRRDDRAVAAMCEELRVCCQIRGLAFSSAGCDAGLRQDMSPTDRAFPPGIIYDAEAERTCLAQMHSQLAGCGSLGTSTPAVCNRVCVGTQPVGPACQSSDECAQPASALVDCNYSSTGLGTYPQVVPGKRSE